MIREREDGTIELDGEELRLVRKVLEALVSALSQRLLAQGVSRRLLVRLTAEAASEVFGAPIRAIDARELLGGEPTTPGSSSRTPS
jgi:hypothetical protein